MSRQHLQLLLESLFNKKKFYIELLNLTKQQNDLLSTNKLLSFDADGFDNLMKEKDVRMQKIADYDQGFESIFGTVKEELQNNKVIYKLEIQRMQHLIKELTELSVQIKNLEFKNKQLLDNIINKQKDNTSKMRSTGAVVSAYGNAMKKIQPGQSYFLDQRH